MHTGACTLGILPLESQLPYSWEAQMRLLGDESPEGWAATLDVPAPAQSQLDPAAAAAWEAELPAEPGLPQNCEKQK